MKKLSKGKIIVAPLYWGLGHASRCVPIIKALKESNFTPVIASDEKALHFLRLEFPELEYLELPSYQITYGKNIKLNLFIKFPRFLSVKRKEYQILNEFIESDSEVVGVISDNRFGCYSKNVPSVYITHQITVFSGITTKLTSLAHQKIIQKYQECWIPDKKGSLLSGELSSKSTVNKKYIGVLSRLKKFKEDKSIDVLIMLSGPEPNRTTLERNLIAFYKGKNEKVVLVRSVIEENQKREKVGNITMINYLLEEELSDIINKSELVICRAGYSSIMDLSVLNKKVILIPTKGQTEQEYLAAYLNKQYQIAFVNEDELEKINLILPQKLPETKVDLPKDLFRLFQRK